jgi:ion channel-forming bestrophin family protein
MAEEGGSGPGAVNEPAESGSVPYSHSNNHDDHRPAHIFTGLRQQLEEELPMSPAHEGRHTPNPFSRHHSTLDLDDYFTGPRDILKHSKWPVFMQMHGSILPKMILPLISVGAWSTLIFCLSHFNVFGVSRKYIMTLLSWDKKEGERD